MARTIEKILAGKVRNRIDKIGIELEGGWLSLPKGVNLTPDGSVRVSDPQGRGLVRGEIPSPPLSPTEWEAWVKAHYPSHVDSSCGLHVHMSFRSALVYQRLMDFNYTKALLTQLRRWAVVAALPPQHHFYGRLKGANKYCLPFYAADVQARQTRKADCRYAAVNYCHGIHQTMEVRVLPMFSDSDIPPNIIKLPPLAPAEGSNNPFDYVASTKVRTKVIDPGRKGVDLAIEAISKVLAVTNAFVLLDPRREQRLVERLAASEISLAPVKENETIRL